MQVPQRFPSEDAHEEAAGFLDRPLLPTLHLSWDKAAIGLIVLLAAALRFWDLGSRAFHHDESLHAVYSWYLYTGAGYTHDPLMHGPFQFQATALTYFLFGATDYTARILPALMGTAMVAMPYFLREHIGRLGAVAASALLALSPVALYYNRFLREDAYVAVWNLLLVIGVWGYIRTGRPVYVMVSAAALSLALATKETTYLTVVILGVYLLATSYREVVARVVNGFDFREASPRVGAMILIGTLTLPFCAASVVILWNVFTFSPASMATSPLGQLIGGLFTFWNGLIGAGSAPDPAIVGKLAVAGPIQIAVLALAAFLGSRWQWGLWRRAALVFFGIFVVLFTTFFTDFPGIGSGMWGALEYWIDQHEIQRGNQPLYYYLLLIPLYEFLPLILAAAGTVYFFVKEKSGRGFYGFLIWWAVAALVLYSFAGEKMPWLSLHIVQPIILMAGMTLGGLLPKVQWQRLREGGAWYIALLVPLLPLAARAIVSSGDLAGGGPEPAVRLLQAVAAAGAVAIMAGAIWLIARRVGWRLVLQTLGLTGLVILSGFSIRTALQASYAHGDIPVEMLVYTQTSPEVPRIKKEIDRIAAESGLGKDMPITVDASEGFTWPWAWYLRDYDNVSYPDLRQSPGNPSGAVLLLNSNSYGPNKPYLAKYRPGQHYPHRWWFPEKYRDLTLPGLAETLVDPGAWLDRWSYFYNRTLNSPLGSSSALVYYPQDYGRGVPSPINPAPISIAPPVDLPPMTQLTGVQVLGSSAQAAGSLQSPRDMALDAEGNLYVVDSGADQVIKFDATGKVLARVGGQGNGNGEFSEPWGISVDKQGNVYVADTWNHRIQKFDANLQFITAWGAFGNAAPADGSGFNPGNFFGPRDVVTDDAGNVYVTDTGNKRVVKFSADGVPLAGFGQGGPGRGQFQEPVGIARNSKGEFYVADTWNRRVQRFDKDFRYMDEFAAVGWTGQGLLNKPYISIDAQDNVLASDPESHRIIRYSATGEVQAVYGRFGSDLSSFNVPAAAVVDPQGRMYVSESGNSRVLHFPPLGN